MTSTSSLIVTAEARGAIRTQADLLRQHCLRLSRVADEIEQMAREQRVFLEARDGSPTGPEAA